jgi:hypothetical protein
MPITAVDVLTATDQGLGVPPLTDPETAQALSVLDEATKVAEILARDRRDPGLAGLGYRRDRQDDLLAPGQRQTVGLLTGHRRVGFASVSGGRSRSEGLTPARLTPHPARS